MVGGPVLQLGYWLRAVRRMQRAIRELRPDLHVPVDSPAMNWHLAAAARAAGARVFYYIAPQVWAWGPWRVRKLARLTDQVACILPFEEPYLRHRGVNARYVGHPLLDTLPCKNGDATLFPAPHCANVPGGEERENRVASPFLPLAAAWGEGAWRVALLPGSRPGEIAAHSAALAGVGDRIRRRWPDARCTFAVRTEACAEAVRRAAGRDDLHIAVARTREVLAAAHFAVAVSGTVTLEAAFFGVPMVIFYRASRLGHRLARPWLLRTPHLSLVNILAGRRLVPELMPWSGRAGPLIETVFEVMDDYGWLCEVRRELRGLVEPLRAPGGSASDNAAELALRLIGRGGGR
jgi:lipid-A-disaccharide synthase